MRIQGWRENWQLICSINHAWYVSICSLHDYILSELAVSLYPLRDQSGQSNSPLLYATGLQTTPPSSSLAPNAFSFFHLSRTRSSCCHIIPSPPSLYHLLNKQNISIRPTHLPMWPPLPFVPPPSLSNNFFTLPPSPSPQNGPCCCKCGCAVWENKAKKLQSDVIKCSTLARGTLHKETF